MNKRLKTYIAGVLICFTAAATEPDILVTQAGESLKVYNLDISASGNVYFTLSEDEDAPIRKISKKDILIIKTADGTKIDPSASISQVYTSHSAKTGNPAQHPPVTHKSLSSEFIVEKKGLKTIVAESEDGQLLRMRLVDELEKTLAVTKSNNDVKYDGEEYVIPEYVLVGDTTYTVEYIDKGAFVNTDIKNVVFPSTLKEIGERAFMNTKYLRRIILPENLVIVWDMAFYLSGSKCNEFEQLYIPAGMEKLCKDVFRHVGPNTSPRGYYQGRLTSIPSFVTSGNCSYYGIDDEAVEKYEELEADTK